MDNILEKFKELSNKKCRLEDLNILKFQEIAELKRQRLQNIKQIDMIENDIRKLLGKSLIKKRSEVR